MTRVQENGGWNGEQELDARNGQLPRGMAECGRIGNGLAYDANSDRGMS